MTGGPCVFCSIVDGGAPAYRVYEDESSLAFLDIRPFARGHTLVVPKVHDRTLLDMAPERAGRLMESAARVAALIRYALAPEGFTLLQANEPAGWQTVFHVHVHVIPATMAYLRWSCLRDRPTTSQRSRGPSSGRAQARSWH